MVFVRVHHPWETKKRDDWHFLRYNKSVEQGPPFGFFGAPNRRERLFLATAIVYKGVAVYFLGLVHVS